MDRICSLIIILACIDPRTEGCKVACAYESYTSGYFSKGKCVCYDEFFYSDLVKKKISLAPRSGIEPESFSLHSLD